MKKNSWDLNFKEHICKNIPNDSSITYFKNPNECDSYYMERVNPDHIGILWGHRKDKTRNWIQIGKVFLRTLWVPFVYIGEQIQAFFSYLVNNLDVTVCCYYIFIALMFYAVVLNIPFVEGVLSCLHR